MNEKNFMKIIKKRENRGLAFKYVYELLGENILDTRNSNNKFIKFKKFLAHFKPIKSTIKIVNDNFIEIFDEIIEDYYIHYIELITGYNELIPKIIEEYEYILNKVKDDNWASKVMINFLNDNDSKFGEKYEKIVSIMGKTNLIKLNSVLKNSPNEFKDQIDKYYEQNKKEIGKQLILNSTNLINKKLRGLEYDYPQEYNDAIIIILDEIMKSENIKFSEIKPKGSGGYSKVFLLGNTILKIGNPRMTYNIPNHRRILQPLVRQEFLDKDNKAFATIEISEAVDTKLSKYNITQEDIYLLYKELRDKGIRCGDLKIENLGVLLKPNKTYYKNEAVSPGSIARGFDRNLSEEETLSKGELVILDSDFLYYDKEYLEKNFDDEQKNIFSKMYMEDLMKGNERNSIDELSER